MIRLVGPEDEEAEPRAVPKRRQSPCLPVAKPATERAHTLLPGYTAEVFSWAADSTSLSDQPVEMTHVCAFQDFAQISTQHT